MRQSSIINAARVTNNGSRHKQLLAYVIKQFPAVRKQDNFPRKRVREVIGDCVPSDCWCNFET